MSARSSLLRFAHFCSFVLGLLATHGSRATADVAGSVEPIVYGTDDRTDVYAEPDPAWQTLAIESVVSLLPNDALVANGATYSVDSITAADALALCPDQRFGDQPSAAYCSGTLIDDDLVLTAGHCVGLPYDTNPDAAPSCAAQRFVFDYYESGPGTLATISQDDVYACRRVVVRHADATLDYAIVQLDRPVKGHVPATLATTSPLLVGTPITVVGSPMGTPIKIAGNATVTSPGPVDLSYFIGDPDTFGGNSGSGVFDDAHHLLGILVRGGEDFVLRVSASCYEVNVVPTTDSREEMTYVARAIGALCGQGYASDRLCGIAPSCGDGFCTAGETTSCPTDCDGNVCGDGVCAKGETNAACALDCPYVAPLPAKAGGCAVTTPGTAGSSAAWLGSLLVLLGARLARRRAPGSGAAARRGPSRALDSVEASRVG